MKKDTKTIAKHIQNTDEDIAQISIKAIQHIVDIVFNTLDEKYGKCQYCKNFKKHFSLFSLCKIKHHLVPQCRYYDIDVRYFVKNNDFELYEKIHLQRKNKCQAQDLWIKKHTRQKIIYKATEIYHAIKIIEK